MEKMKATNSKTIKFSEAFLEALRKEIRATLIEEKKKCSLLNKPN